MIGVSIGYRVSVCPTMNTSKPHSLRSVAFVQADIIRIDTMNKKVMITHTNGKTIHHVVTVDNDDTIVIHFTDGTYSEIKAEVTSSRLGIDHYA